MDARELEQLKADAKKRWLTNWERLDFTWKGLGAVIDGEPRWAWHGHYVEPDGRVVRLGKQSPQARKASVQDYWALDVDSGFVRSTETMKSLGLIKGREHPLFHFLNSESYGAVSNSVRNRIDKEIQSRIDASTTDRFSYISGGPSGFDGRIQIVGAISERVNEMLNCPNLYARHSRIKDISIDYIVSLYDNYEISNSLFESDITIAPISAKQINLSYNNYIEQVYLSISDEAASLDFSGSKFWSRFECQNGEVGYFNVSSSTFYDSFWLPGTVVRGDLDAYWATFFGEVFLERIKVNKGAVFSYSKFHNYVDISGGVFEGEFKSVNTHFLGDFRAGPDRRMDGSEVPTRFKGPLDFYGSQFDAAVSFDDCEMPTEKSYRHGFKMAKFSSHVAWSRNALHAISMWANARVDGSVVLPHADTVTAQRTFARRALDDAKAAGTDALIALGDGAQTLKKALLDNGDFLRAQALHKLELQAKMLLGSTPRSERVAAYLYGAFSDWGLCWHRPLFWLIGGAILFAGIYNWFILLALGHQFGPVTFGIGLPVHSAIAAGIELSMSNALGPIRYLIGNDGPPGLDAVEVPFLVRFGLGFLSILQQIGSLALLFLSALALRRRFQIG